MHFLADPFPHAGRPVRHVVSPNSPALIWPLQGWCLCLVRSLEMWPWQVASPEGSSWYLRSISSLLCKVFMAQLKIFMEFCPVLSNYILEFCSILWKYILELCHLIIQQFGWLWVKTVDDDSGHFVSITIQCGLEKAFREFKEQCIFFS